MIRMQMRIEGKSTSAVCFRLHVPWVGPLPQRQASVQQGLGREGLSNPLRVVEHSSATMAVEHSSATMPYHDVQSSGAQLRYHGSGAQLRYHARTR